MGFNLGRVATGVATGGLSEVFRAASPHSVSAPNIGTPPTLNQYGAYPEFTPQELDYLQKQQQLLDQYNSTLNGQKTPSAFEQSSNQIGEAENKNYLEALNQSAGTLSEGQKQQQKKDFDKLVQAAGSRGIRILGTDPMSATSDSTAGNQILSDFNQRYQTLADQNRQAQIQLGGNQNISRLGLNQNASNSNYANILNLQTAYGNQMAPYQQQRLGLYGTQNANVDIQNQGLLNNYQSAYNQQLLNYQANAQNQTNRMGFINSLIGLGGTVAGAAIGGGLAGRAPAAAGSIPNGYSPYQNYNKLSL